MWPFTRWNNSMRCTKGPICPVQASSQSSSPCFLTRRRWVDTCAPAPCLARAALLLWADAGIRRLCFLRTCKGRPNPEVRAKQNEIFKIGLLPLQGQNTLSAAFSEQNTSHLSLQHFHLALCCMWGFPKEKEGLLLPYICMTERVSPKRQSSKKVKRFNSKKEWQHSSRNVQTVFNSANGRISSF